MLFKKMDTTTFDILKRRSDIAGVYTRLSFLGLASYYGMAHGDNPLDTLQDPKRTLIFCAGILFLCIFGWLLSGLAAHCSESVKLALSEMAGSQPGWIRRQMLRAVYGLFMGGFGVVMIGAIVVLFSQGGAD